MYVNFENVRSALKAVLFEEGSGTNVKNIEKISCKLGGAREKQAPSPRFIRKRPFNEPNCSEFLFQHDSCF
ncbi:hypothetical protein [Holospora elegans]|uniref:hypothetical protein n=1 Tax=Holospora elegans TaxID=431043 RepID=UPI000558DF80|nr:hypothetical protein [Holospora elegans]